MPKKKEGSPPVEGATAMEPYMAMFEMMRQQREDDRREMQRREDLEDRRRVEDNERREEAERRRDEAEDRRRREETERRVESERRLLLALEKVSQCNQPPDGSTDATGTPQTPPPRTPQLKPSANPPPHLPKDVTLRAYKAWLQRWQDYADLIDLPSLPRPKQLIHFRACLTEDMRQTLEIDLGVPPDTSKTLDEVLALLQTFVRDQTNEALRRLEFSRCSQASGEKFSDFYARLKHAADEVDLCKGDPDLCRATQLKHALILGIQDDLTRKRLISMKSTSSLEEALTLCRSDEAAVSTSQVVRPTPQAARAVSTYKQSKKNMCRVGGVKRTVALPTAPISSPSRRVTHVVMGVVADHI